MLGPLIRWLANPAIRSTPLPMPFEYYLMQPLGGGHISFLAARRQPDSVEHVSLLQQNKPMDVHWDIEGGRGG